MWTREEPYPEPDAELLGAAAEWRERLSPERLRELVESLPAPRSRLHAPEAMTATDELIADAWRAAGWRVGRQRIRIRRAKGVLDYRRPGQRPGRRPRWHTYTDLEGLDPLDIPVVGPALGLHPMARNFSRSDHVRFWEAGLPAIQVTNTGNFRNPNYHRPTDTSDTLDYETLARIGAASALLIEDLAS